MNRNVELVTHDIGPYVMDAMFAQALDVRRPPLAHQLDLHERIDKPIALADLLKSLHLIEVATIAARNDGDDIATLFSALYDPGQGTTADHEPQRRGVLASVTIGPRRLGLLAFVETADAAGQLKVRWDRVIDAHVVMPEADSQVKLELTFLAPQGVSGRVKMIEAPAWEEIRDNYPNRADIDYLVGLERPWEAGKLFLWHGPPGTGKTFAARALMRAWGARARIIYPMDPERVFGDSSYLFHLMTEVEEIDGRFLIRRKRVRARRPCPGEGPPSSGDEDSSIFVLFLLEDALDILLEENRGRLGPSMARLLNLSEGILGQGLNLVLGFTTNHSLVQIDPAFLRPGRCLQVLEFPLLSQAEALAFFERQGTPVPSKFDDRSAHWPLADLYARGPRCTPTLPLILGEEKAINGFNA